MVLSVTTGSIQPILHVQAPWPTLIGPRAKVYKVPCYAQAKAILWPHNLKAISYGQGRLNNQQPLDSTMFAMTGIDSRLHKLQEPIKQIFKL